MNQKQKEAIEKLRMDLAIDDTPLPEIKSTHKERETFKFYTDRRNNRNGLTNRLLFQKLAKGMIQNKEPLCKKGHGYQDIPNGTAIRSEFRPQKPIKPEDLHIGCLNCSTTSLTVSMSRTFYYDTELWHDGHIVWAATNNDNPADGVSARTIERLACNFPYCDWRIVFKTMMHGETFQRHGTNNWVCIESNEGMA